MLTLDNEFIQYCKINNIEDVNGLAQKTFSRGFSILKYGETPTNNVTTKIVEVIKEVPVEVIKEVIVEKQGKTKTITREVIKEIPVEKVVEVFNNDEIEKLKIENQQLKDELNKITTSLENLNRHKFKKVNDNNLYDE
jgi:hypothetical protein